MYGIQEDISDDETEPALNRNVEDALASFREKWQQELCITTKKKQSGANKFTDGVGAGGVDVDADEDDDDSEEKAKMWFLKGSELERSGIFYEAIQCYKKAVQLVPDIELRICQKRGGDTYELDNNPTDGSTPDANRSFDHDHDDDEEEEEVIKPGVLLQHIQRKMLRCTAFCTPEYEQRALHISSLPTEILLYIFKWIVSADLDLRSLEVCSMVSRGFFLAARDQEIWKLACVRVWGANCGTPTSMYPTWRDMYLQRPRLHHNGCYISKTTYIRHGENSFQDQFYRPWHLVCYYRYLRFFPEGIVLMMTTPDEPHACVSLLKNRHTKQMVRGHYRIKDDRVILVVQDTQRERAMANKFFKMSKSKKAQQQVDSNGEQTFHLEFQIVDQGKRKHVQLVWKHYSVFIKHKNGTESKSCIEITNNRFPALWFSRVKSYTKETHTPLI